jgi:hypothetical protein
VSLGAACLLAAACSASPDGPDAGSDGGEPCAVEAGVYLFKLSEGDGEGCQAVPYEAVWPPSGPSCSTDTALGACRTTCWSDVPVGPEAYTYTLTPTGFSGTVTEPAGMWLDGGAITCTYAFTAAPP